ncbi:MAG: AtpZ/AtpI family protein [Patescibacteria group bacterium]|jgi:F0F1-type ATP synthase assembly protein I|nr:AtpZ/AtpI family protein [Patescibacteria group bacterium]
MEKDTGKVDVEVRKADLDQNTQDTKAWWQPAMTLFLRMSVWIVTPVIVAVFVGKWVDKTYGTEPWGFLGIMGLSFFFSMFVIIKMVLQEYTKIEKNEEKSKK